MPSLNIPSAKGLQAGPVAGPTYWRSLEEVADTPEFRALVEREFPNYAPEIFNSLTRRRFLKLMGASMALAGLTGCRRWPKEHLAPYAHRPEGRTPGEPEFYASAMELGGVAKGVIVTSYDGRPIKIEGNPDHPGSLGAADVFAQASVLELYDPDRSRLPVHRGAQEPVYRDWGEWQNFAREHFRALRQRGGQGLAVLCDVSDSPTLKAQRQRFLNAFPQAVWCEYTPVSRENELAGSRLAFGDALRSQLHLDKAEVIACFDADLLLGHPNAVRYARDFATGRRSADDGRMNRLFVAESVVTTTGSCADYRRPVKASAIGPMVKRLAIVVGAVKADDAKLEGEAEAFVQRLAADLKEDRGAGVVAVGPGQPAEVHALAHAINDTLGNHGKTITFAHEPDAELRTHTTAIKTLADKMTADEMDTLIVLGGNPVYDAPADVAFADALKKVKTSIHLSQYQDETSLLCTWHMPRAHYLESWGDVRAYDGTISVVQPLIEPLYNGKSPIELLSTILDEHPRGGLELVQGTFQGMLGGYYSEKGWRRVLHDGLLTYSAFEAVTPKVDSSAIQDAAGRIKPTGDGVEVVFHPDRSLYDGRFANNGWLQELPDAITNVVWDNMAAISPATAKQLGVGIDDVVRVKLGAHELELPVFVLPGQAPGVIGVALGYGRTASGKVGNKVGVNAYAARTTDTMHIVPATATVTGRKYNLATTQVHHAIDQVGLDAREERLGPKGKSGPLIREATLAQYRKDPQFAHRVGHDLALTQLWDVPTNYDDGHRWGMTIDLTTCVGCNACMTACQAENNVPIVGKDQVLKGREMHWIRVDRYFKGAPDDPNPEIVHQPVACHHCENAPCEQVCPVAATMHDSEGLNTMVYNRCIGTRYCSNNCPYKVRRFNYFDFHSKDPRGEAMPWLGMPDTQQQAEVNDIKRMVFNPEVTVRMRGVMEKCTYCVQRIHAAKSKATVEKRTLKDGEITPACAQTCPTNAITFGDLNDPASRVRKQQENVRSYAMLEDLNVRPRTKFLAKIRNTETAPGKAAGIA